MPIPSKYLATFHENEIYHIYNLTNNKEKLFLSDENRHFFLLKYNEYMSTFLDTFCWSLLPNHFHLLVRTKDTNTIRTTLATKTAEELTRSEKKFLQHDLSLNDIVSRSFKRFFQCYTLSLNKTTNRKGNLFNRPFKRVELNKEKHFTQAIIYIHANAIKHSLTNNFTLYPWSSWHTLLSDKPTFLLRDEIFDWFGNRELFIKSHLEMFPFYYETEIAIEE